MVAGEQKPREKGSDMLYNLFNHALPSLGETCANHDSHDLEQSGPWLFRLLDSIRYGGRVADQVQPLMPGVGMATRVNH